MSFFYIMRIKALTYKQKWLIYAMRKRQSKTKVKYMTTEEKEILRQKQIISGKEHANNLTMCVNNLSGEELTEHQRKAHKGMIEKRKEKKRIKDITSELLNMKADDIAENVLNSELAEKIKETDITLYDLIVAKQIEVALTSGNVKSAEFLRDSNGDKPTDKIENNVNVITESDQLLLTSIQNRLDSLESIETESKEV